MNPLSPHTICEHVLDVMRGAMKYHAASEPFALATITNTEGGAVRAPGAMMAVGQGGDTVGYVSGGCIDGDVALRAVRAIKSKVPQMLRYGTGSPFIDIRLPCGGAIDLVIQPNPDIAVLQYAIENLQARKPIAMRISQHSFECTDWGSKGDDMFHYRPKLNLRIAGRGTDPLALARLANAAGLGAEIWSPDEACLNEAEFLGRENLTPLTMPNDLPNQRDDKDTAFVLMFHDHEWEPALLESALEGDAFYVGAVGSHSAHTKRCELLRSQGLLDEAINRIHAPIGMIPSMRDASMLAVSTLAEIVDAYHSKGAQ